MKEITFEDAFMVNYAETFSNFGEHPMTERVTLSAKKISVQSGKGAAEHSNLWSDK